jgi:trehalose 6-phosphate phosphatase
MQKAPPRLTGRGYALFLDVDGTILDLARTPGEVVVNSRVLSLLAAVRDACAGAWALISGRSIADLDTLFEPLTLPAAGLHGAQRRGVEGVIVTSPPGRPLDEARTALVRWCAAHPGTLIEDKGGAIALHYRLAPHFEAEARREAAAVTQRLAPEYVLQEGKQVIEIKPAGASKAEAIRQFMREPPFASCVPVFLGDDVTDEDGLEAVRAMGGYAITVGPRESRHAGWRLEDPAAVRHWLSGLAASRAGPAS